MSAEWWMFLVPIAVAFIPIVLFFCVKSDEDEEAAAGGPGGVVSTAMKQRNPSVYGMTLGDIPENGDASEMQDTVVQVETAIDSAVTPSPGRHTSSGWSTSLSPIEIALDEEPDHEQTVGQFDETFHLEAKSIGGGEMEVDEEGYRIPPPMAPMKRQDSKDSFFSSDEEEDTKPKWSAVRIRDADESRVDTDADVSVGIQSLSETLGTASAGRGNPNRRTMVRSVATEDSDSFVAFASPSPSSDSFADPFASPAPASASAAGPNPFAPMAHSPLAMTGGAANSTADPFASPMPASDSFAFSDFSAGDTVVDADDPFGVGPPNPTSQAHSSSFTETQSELQSDPTSVVAQASRRSSTPSVPAIEALTLPPPPESTPPISQAASVVSLPETSLSQPAQPAQEQPVDVDSVVPVQAVAVAVAASSEPVPEQRPVLSVQSVSPLPLPTTKVKSAVTKAVKAELRSRDIKLWLLPYSDEQGASHVSDELISSLSAAIEIDEVNVAAAVEKLRVKAFNRKLQLLLDAEGAVAESAS
eukprot:m.65795 g.65795  ORF g.65795 m.65795 type:complete len:530 (+) comp12075_c0_seq2:209-1798(+)